MSAPYSNLASKLEQAAAVLAAASAGANATVFTGQSDLDKDAPCIICAADQETAEEDPPFTGNFWIDLEIQVKGIAAIDADGLAPKAAYDTLVATTFDTFSATALLANLNGAGIADFTCQGFVPKGPGFRTEEDAWVNTLSFRIYCCASTL